MRACYFLQTHVNPEQIHRLVRLLKRGSPEARILIGHDVASGALDLRPLADLSGVDSFDVHGPLDRAGMGVLEPYLTAIAWLARWDVDFDWLIYLTGQDYPTLPLHRIESELAASGQDGFLSYWDIRSPTGYWGHDSRRGERRYHYQYRPLPAGLRWLKVLKSLNSVQPYLHVSTAYGPRLGIRAHPPPFSDARPCYAGDQWHALSRVAVEHLARALVEQADLVRYFRRTLCPCEALVQTLLASDAKLRLHNDSRRYVDFSATREGRPRVLTAADFPTLTGGRYHFARKVDTRVDPRLLDLLDAWVLA